MPLCPLVRAIPLVMAAGMAWPGYLFADGETPARHLDGYAIAASEWNIAASDYTFARDARFFQATLCRRPNDWRLDNKTKVEKAGLFQDIAEGENRLRILTRVFALLAYGQMTLHVDPASKGEAWPWNIATALAHGQRVLVQCDGFDALDLYKVLVEGANPSDSFKDPYGRAAATHAVDVENDQIVELKNKNVVSNLYKGLKGQHHGIDLPVGGVGNPWPDGQHIVGPLGQALDAKHFTRAKGLQHGHLYMHHQTFQSSTKGLLGGLLIGIEGSAPSCTNMFQSTHSVSSGHSDQTQAKALFGGQKWAAWMKTDGPAEYGGKRIRLAAKGTGPSLEDFKAVVGMVDRLSGRNYDDFIGALLGAESGDKAKDVLNAAMAKAAKPKSARP